MLNAKAFLAVDFGAARLKLAEFETTDADGLGLRRYGVRPLPQEALQETTRRDATQQTLRELVAEQACASKTVSICAPGFQVFSKFIKLPPVDNTRVAQIIRYEAQQNIPFPLEEVVWDHQIIGASTSGETEVLLVAIRKDIVDGMLKCVEGAGLRLQLLDVSAAALFNAFRYNYPDLEGCTMLLDIGAKTSKVLFFEGDKMLARVINIGAHAITQDLAKELKLSTEQAEQLKVTEGFVSLGGAVEEPEDQHAAVAAKIARQVMTRLHVQINQTIQFYRDQHGGSPVQRLFLSGGGATMAFTPEFFAEKLHLPVEFFNPFRHVQIDPAINVEELAKVAHSFGELVGLALRGLAHCPLELNLMPPALVRQQRMRNRQPAFLTIAMCVIVGMLAAGRYFTQEAEMRRRVEAELAAELAVRNEYRRQIDTWLALLLATNPALNDLRNNLQHRFYWDRLFADLRRLAMEVENEMRNQSNVDAGLWIERLEPLTSFPPAPGGPPPRPQFKPPAGNQVIALSLECASVDLTVRAKPEYNDQLAFLFLKKLQAHPLFAPASAPLGKTTITNGIFRFRLLLPLREPLSITP